MNDPLIPTPLPRRHSPAPGTTLALIAAFADVALTVGLGVLRTTNSQFGQRRAEGLLPTFAFAIVLAAPGIVALIGVAIDVGEVHRLVFMSAAGTRRPMNRSPLPATQVTVGVGRISVPQLWVGWLGVVLVGGGGWGGVFFLCFFRLGFGWGGGRFGALWGVFPAGVWRANVIRRAFRSSAGPRFER